MTRSSPPQGDDLRIPRVPVPGRRETDPATADTLLAFSRNTGVRKGIDRLTKSNETLAPLLSFVTPAQSVCNYGTLLSPRPLAIHALGPLKGKWVLVQFDGGACAAVVVFSGRYRPLTIDRRGRSNVAKSQHRKTQKKCESGRRGRTRQIIRKQ